MKPKPTKPPSPVSSLFYLKVHLNTALAKVICIKFNRIFSIFTSSHFNSVDHKLQINALQHSFPFFLGNGQQLCSPMPPRSRGQNQNSALRAPPALRTQLTDVYLINVQLKAPKIPPTPHLQNSKTNTQRTQGFTNENIFISLK